MNVTLLSGGNLEKFALLSGGERMRSEEAKHHVKPLIDESVLDALNYLAEGRDALYSAIQTEDPDTDLLSEAMMNFDRCIDALENLRVCSDLDFIYELDEMEEGRETIG